MRAFESKCEFLLGERLVVMRLDRVAVAAEFLVWGYAEVPTLCVLDERAWARGGVSFVGVYARHADIEDIVVSVLLNFGTQACRSCCIFAPGVPLRRTAAQRSLHAFLRRRPTWRLALLPIAEAFVGVDAGDAAASGVCHALLAAVPAAAPTGSRTRQSAGCSGAHGRVLALEALASPGVGKAEGFKVLLVLLLWRLAVFGPRHGLARFVDVAGPCLVGV